MDNDKPLKSDSLKGSSEPQKKARLPAQDVETGYANAYTDTVKDLNSKILKMTQMIHESFPELDTFLNEMPEQLNPLQELESLKKYYESLHAIFSKYRLEHIKRPQK